MLRGNTDATWETEGFPWLLRCTLFENEFSDEIGNLFVIPRDETREGYEEHSNNSDFGMKNSILHSANSSS